MPEHLRFYPSSQIIFETRNLLMKPLGIEVPYAAAWTTQPFPKYHYDVRNSGRYPYDPDYVLFSGNDNSLHLISASSGSLVRKITVGSVYSHPVVDDSGIVYVGVVDTLYAINLADGSTLWTYTAGGSINSTPAIAEYGGVKRIYFGCNDAKLYAVNASDGSLIWSRNLNNAVSRSSPNVYQDQIYIGDSSVLYRVSPDSTIVWSRTFNSNAWEPAVDPTLGRVIDTDFGSYVRAFTLAGSSVWANSTPDGGPPYPGPSIDSSGVIYFGTQYHFIYGNQPRIYAFNPDGSTKWYYNIGTASSTHDNLSTPAIDSSNNIYSGSKDGDLISLNSSGAERWRYSTGGWVRDVCIDVNDNIYFTSDAGYCYCVDSSGSLQWSYNVGTTGKTTGVVLIALV